MYPIGEKIGFSPVHFTMVFFITLLFGGITPPVGIQLYITSIIAGIRVVMGDDRETKKMAATTSWPPFSPARPQVTGRRYFP